MTNEEYYLEEIGEDYIEEPFNPIKNTSNYYIIPNNILIERTSTYAMTENFQRVSLILWPSREWDNIKQIEEPKYSHSLSFFQQIKFFFRSLFKL